MAKQSTGSHDHEEHLAAFDRLYGTLQGLDDKIMATLEAGIAAQEAGRDPTQGQRGLTKVATCGTLDVSPQRRRRHSLPHRKASV